MPRPKLKRKIAGVPPISGLTPYGFTERGKRRQSIFLHYEEYESIRLCDYERLTQLEASKLMQISRPTLTRIYSSAREKIATALSEGRKLIIEGGKVELNEEWMICNSCQCYFTINEEKSLETCCALCGSKDVTSVNVSEVEAKEEEISMRSPRGMCKRRRRNCF